MAKAGLDALLLTSPQSVNYISGMDTESFVSFQALIVPIDQEPRLIIYDFEAARAEISSCILNVVLYSIAEDPVVVTARTLRAISLKKARIGIEQRGFSASAYHFGRLCSALPDATVSDPFGIVEAARLVKSSAELALMRQAAKLTDTAIAAAYSAIHVGVTDKEIAGVIASTLYGGGSDTLCWGPIVASGYLAGAPHSTFVGRRIEVGETVFLELTGQVRRYTAPAMRTLILGDPSEDQMRVARVGAETIETIVREARAGRAASEVARAAESVVGSIADSVLFHHTFGYPVGLGLPPTWVEALNFLIRSSNPRPLVAGMVFHLPISLRRYGEWGVNQSQTVVITDSGCEMLTESEHRLHVVQP